MKPDEGMPSLMAGGSRLAASAIGVVAALMCSSTLVQAKDAVPNLGGGLEQVAASASGAQAAAPASVQRRSSLAATSEETPAEEIGHSVQFDDAGRALVRISLDGKTPAASVLQQLQASPDVEVVATDMSYRSGVVEAWVPASSL